MKWAEKKSKPLEESEEGLPELMARLCVFIEISFCVTTTMHWELGKNSGWSICG